jgi:dTDP-4-dehydrorhamnose reductase
MRILLTGVSGQVGRALQEPLAEFGTVIAADRGLMDLSRPSTLSRLLDSIEPDLIVNPAAYTAVDLAEDETALAFRVNAEAPAVLAAWAAPRRVPLLHLSTDYVFDGSGDRPWREDDATGPLSVYGASKLAGEQGIAAAGGPHLILRTSWVYDATGKNFLRTIARLAAEREELRIVADQVGAPTSASGIADAVVAILREELPDAAPFSRRGGLLHLAMSGHTSWHGFASAIVEGLRRRGGPVKTTHVVPIASGEFPTRATRPSNSRLDLGRLRDVFGVVTPRWEAALERELDRLIAPVPSPSLVPGLGAGQPVVPA